AHLALVDIDEATDFLFAVGALDGLYLARLLHPGEPDSQILVGHAATPLFLRHARESGHPGQVLRLRPLDPRLRGGDGLADRSLYVFAASAASTRSRVNGIWRNRTPVASWMALARPGHTLSLAGSPTRIGGRSGRSISTTSTASGMSVKPMIG